MQSRHPAPQAVGYDPNADEIVSFEESRALAARLSDAGVYNVLHPLEGVGHELTGKLDEVVDTITAFLDPLLTGRARAVDETGTPDKVTSTR